MPFRPVIYVFITIISMETVASIIAVSSNVAFTFHIDCWDMGRTTAPADSKEDKEKGYWVI